MTLTQFWSQVLAEIKALGWRCVAYGPEAWLAIPTLCGALVLAAVVGFLIFANWRD